MYTKSNNKDADNNYPYNYYQQIINAVQFSFVTYLLQYFTSEID